MRYAGLNAICFLVEWSLHQPWDSPEYFFGGRLNLTRYIQVGADASFAMEKCYGAVNSGCSSGCS